MTSEAPQIGQQIASVVWRGGVTLADFEASLGDQSNPPCPGCAAWWQRWAARLTEMAAESANRLFTVDDVRAFGVIGDSGLTDGDIELIASYLVRARPEVARRVRLWLADTASTALPVFEQMRPGDQRVRAAISTAREFADGTATNEERLAAKTAAGEVGRGFGGGPSHFAALAAQHSLGVKLGYVHQMHLCSTNAARALATTESGEIDLQVLDREQRWHLICLDRKLAE